MFGISKIWNSSVSKGQNLEFQCFEKAQFRIPMFKKAQV